MKHNEKYPRLLAQDPALPLGLFAVTKPLSSLGCVLKMLVFCPPIALVSNEGRKASLIKAAKLPASFSYLVENRRNFFSHPKHRSTTFRLR